MKGAIYIVLNDMIENQFGLEVWEELLAEVQPESKGIYTSTKDYHEKEIVDFIVAISKKLDISVEDVQRKYGQYLFSELNKKYPQFTQINAQFFPFLHSIHDIIHKEVEKLYTQPSLPEIICTTVDAHHLQMRYQSPRKMCHLAEGLILGAADFFEEKAEITQTQCMHEGFDHCILKIKTHAK